MLNRALDFLTNHIWRIEFEELPTHQRVLLRPLRVLVLAVRGFDEDRIQLRASALTFYSLLAMVPALAVAFGIAKGFGLQEALEGAITNWALGQEPAFGQMVEWAKNLLGRTRGGVLAGVGVAFLFWAVIRLLSTIELSLNDIWGLPKGRAFGRRVADYLAVALIGPLLLTTTAAVMGAFSGFLDTQVTATAPLQWTGQILRSGLPYVALMLFLTGLFRYMPNTHVTLRAAVLAGVVGGTIYQITQLIYVRVQVYVADQNAIYGTFAAVPLFLIWLQVSWLVVLFGAEIAYAVDNEETYAADRDWAHVSIHFQRLLALRFVERACKQFQEGEEPLSAADLAHELELPVRHVRRVLYDLVTAGALVEMDRGRAHESTFQPARDISGLTIKWVLDALNHAGQEPGIDLDRAQLSTLADRLRHFDSLIEESPDNVPLHEI